MARSKKTEPTDAELVELMAARFGITLAPAGGRTFDVMLPERQLRVEIKMSVAHEATRDEQHDFKERALDILRNPDNAWRDRCDCSTTKKERYRNYHKGCSKPPVGVVVTKVNGTWNGSSYDYTKPSYGYSFRCRTHLDKPDRDELRVVFRSTFVHEINLAREERQAAQKERTRLAAMTDVERIAEDARMELRPSSKALAAEIEKQIRHSYRCERFRTDDEELRLSRNGDPSKPCTCGPELRASVPDIAAKGIG